MIKLLYFMNLAETIICKYKKVTMPVGQEIFNKLLIIFNNIEINNRQISAAASKLQMTINKNLLILQRLPWLEMKTNFCPLQLKAG
jgi:hypothetical protein